MSFILNKRGSQFVEASFAVPVIILTVLLLVRIFVFYLEILNMGVKSHEKVFEEWDSYNKGTYYKYSDTQEVSMLRGGILGIDLKKTLDIEAYFYNEDRLLRSRLIAETDKE